MHRGSRVIGIRLLLAGLFLPVAAHTALGQVSVRAVKVVGNKGAVEIEVEASDRIVPQTQVLTGPDRLVIDFPNAVPGSELRSQSVDRGQVKDMRVGLFQSKPPVTRVVLDLKTAQSYQIFPSGRTVMIKVTGAGEGAPDRSAGVDNFPPEATRPGLVTANYNTRSEPVSVDAAKPGLEVSYREGLLGVRANKVTLSEVLFAIQQRTGADISIAAGAEQEKIVTDIAPAPAPEVLAQLLNGSRFNFLILSSPNDPRKLDRVILSVRTDGGMEPPPAPMPAQSQESADEPLPAPPVQGEALSPPPPTSQRVPPQPPDVRNSDDFSQQ